MLGGFSVRSRTWAIGLGAVALAVAAGCTRDRYRREADQDVCGLVTEKSNDPRWGIAEFSIAEDPRSRYFDPYNPDCEPMPQDDPASHVFMHEVACMKGCKHWHEFGDAAFLENPQWREALSQYAPMDDRGNVILSLDSAVNLSLIHSPSYQEQLETIYLSALDTSTERFRFEVQFFGGNTARYAYLGQGKAGGESSTLTNSTSLQLQRRFATAGELLVGFANSVVWQFSGPESRVSTSLFNFNLVQPLLRAGGRAVALEQLTLTERTLLANLRAFERYRQGFYTNIAVGESGVSGPARRGGFFGGTGLTGFTGQGSGGLGGVGEATGFGRTGFGTTGGGGAATGAGFAGGGAGTVGGFIGLLQQLQQVRNTHDSLNSQVRTLGLLEANLEAGLIDIAQVDQFRQNIETEKANLLQAQDNLANGMESFLTGTLGLPPDLPLELDDRLIRQFQFISPQTTAAQNAVGDFINGLGSLPKEPAVAELTKKIDALEGLRPAVAAQFDQVEADLVQLGQIVPGRQTAMTPEDAKRLGDERQRLVDTLAELRKRFKTNAERITQLRAGLNEKTRAESADQLVAVASELLRVAEETALVQARARLESVTIDPVTLSPEEALRIARASRLDWMNNRAALVDSWRLIEYNANALQSTLNLTLSGDVGTISNSSPKAFSGPTGSVQAGLQFDGPFTRLLERNNYRQALIDYQRDRRQLIQYEDSVNLGLRRTLRLLEELRLNLEIQRRAVVIAVRRVDQTQESLSKPPEPVKPGEPAAQLGPTAAQNLLTALSDLRNSQNNFMSVWLNYYARRMTLMRDLGVMEIDETGRWVDRPLGEALAQAPEEPPLPPPLPAEWLQEAGVDPRQIDSAPAALEAPAAVASPAGPARPRMRPAPTVQSSRREGGLAPGGSG
jgi:outer membrane protein TolC